MRKDIVTSNLETMGLFTPNICLYLCCRERYFRLDGNGFAKCSLSHVALLKLKRCHCFPYVLHIQQFSQAVGERDYLLHSGI